MLLLGIESSCDETSAAVVECDGTRAVARSNIVASQIDVHRLYGGVVPEIASRAHIEAISSITYRALADAGVTLGDIECVGVTDHPGLIGALLVGVNFAKALAVSNRIPLVPVDHIRAHIAAAYLDRGEGIVKPPYLALVVSGGHTSLFYARSYTDYTLLGSTRDDAIGEAFDKIGRVIGIPYPAGAGFDALAREGFLAATGGVLDYDAYRKSAAGRDRATRLPSPAIPDSYDFSFSGLKSASINLLHHYEQTGEAFDRAAFAARYTDAACGAVAMQVSRALGEYPDCPLVVSGGVAANTHLREMLCVACEKHRTRLILPPRALCGDNGAMTATQAYFEYRAGHVADASLNASAAD